MHAPCVFLGVGLTTLREYIKSTLTDDATLMALATGGISETNDVDRDGGSASDAPYEDDDVTLKPHIKIRYRGGNRRVFERMLKTEDESIEFYAYADRGYTVIDQMIERLRILDDTHITGLSDRSFVHLLITFRSPELAAPEYGNAPMRFVRFSTVQKPRL